ncbi:hypothetical protein AAEU32_10480 [Pseudoalteromonas sp. SSDWG2]
MKPVNTLDQTVAHQVAVKPSKRKAKMMAKLNRFGKELALSGVVRYK